MSKRRELLKGLAVGSAWATPVVSSVMLPVHASTSVTVYSRTNLTTPAEGTQQGSTDHIRACVTLIGTTAEITFQSIFGCEGIPPAYSDALLVGTINNGSGTIFPTSESAVALSEYSAQVTEITPSTLKLTVTGKRPITLILPVVNQCVDFIPNENLDSEEGECGR